MYSHLGNGHLGNVWPSRLLRGLTLGTDEKPCQSTSQCYLVLVQRRAHRISAVHDRFSRSADMANRLILISKKFLRLIPCHRASGLHHHDHHHAVRVRERTFTRDVTCHMSQHAPRSGPICDGVMICDITGTADIHQYQSIVLRVCRSAL